MTKKRLRIATLAPSVEQIAQAVARIEPALPGGIDPAGKKPLPPTVPLTRNLIFSGGTYHKNAEMPKDAGHHKQQRAILANNIFVQISSQNPTMKRSERKRLAKKLARERVAALLKRRAASAQELNALREQDYREARPAEGGK